MVTQEKITTDAPITAENGVHRLPNGEISAYEHLKKFIGIYKDDPVALEVWREIAMSRHPERPYREPGFSLKW